MTPRDRGSRLTASLRHSKTLLLSAEGRRVPALDLHGNPLCSFHKATSLAA
jgi:hypothetical protein